VVGFVVFVLDEFAGFVWGQEIWWTSVFNLISNLVQLCEERAVAWARRWRGHCLERNAHGGSLIDALKVCLIFAFVEGSGRLS